MIFKDVREGRPYPEHGLSMRDWARIPPRQIRMDELRAVATVDALAAGALAFAGAEEELSEPERETLLAYAAASLDEETGG